MFLPLFFLFVLMPIIEIAVLIQVGSVLGAFNTIALLVLTAIVGASLVRSQGIRTMQSAQLKMAQGQLPGREMVSGIMIFIAGVMFITPGFVTDLIALLMLIPAVQSVMGVWLLKRVQVHGTATHFQFHSHQQTRSQDSTQESHQPKPGNTLEGEYQRKDDEEKN